jgi:coproporphyrinogen III oxidase-like Fe-S oxidoreductase
MQAADLFEATRAITAPPGLPAYEISNHARIGRGEPAQSDLLALRDYAGVGPGAHGRRGGLATSGTRSPRTGWRRSSATATAWRARSRSAPHDRATEALLMGLRLREGVDDRILAEIVAV